VNLASAIAARPPTDETPGARVVVNVRPTADAAAEYVVVGWDGRSAVEYVFNGDQLDAYMRDRATAAAERQDEVRCLIRADRDVPYRYVERAIRSCGLAKIRRVSFAAISGPDAEGGG
jgi:biopolymer transport protein ExbD